MSSMGDAAHFRPGELEGRKRGGGREGAGMGEGSADRTSSRNSGTSRGAERIRRIIEGEIIPRMLLSYVAEPSARSPRQVLDEDVEELARLSLVHRGETTHAFVQTLLDEGLPGDRARLELLGPAARLLGELWASDRCTFADVTMGLGTLQLVLRRMGLEEDHFEPHRGAWGSIVVASMPGDEHGFGAQMVSDFLTREGWSIQFLPRPSCRELERSVQEPSVGGVCLSVTYQALLEDLPPLVSRLRSRASRSDLMIAVGGEGVEKGQCGEELRGVDVVTNEISELIGHLNRLVSGKGAR